MAEDADLIVTLGGASVGDHDLVQDVAADRGLDLSFYKIAMRPGKPLMAGKLGAATMVGLPGNPVSSMVCGQIFVRPLVDALLGLGFGRPGKKPATLGAPLGPNGPRAHYMRATVTEGTRRSGLHSRRPPGQLSPHGSRRRQTPSSSARHTIPAARQLARPWNTST